jgi:hypothetical protein
MMRDDPFLLPRDVSRAEKYDPAMKVETQQQADDYFVLLLEHCLRCNPPSMTRQEAEKIERSNLGYWAGYFPDETRKRVERLFKCEHPIFGSIAKNGAPTAAQAYAMGLARGMADGKK